MDSMFSLFFLFIAVLTALLTYLVMPYVPISVLIIVSAILLVGGFWWHWTQFSVDYRLSTWQELLRNYASYALLLLAILLSYGFYVFVWVSNGGNITAAIGQIQDNISQRYNNISNKLSRSYRSLTSESEAL
jgi:hypothetical protein